MFDIVHPLLGIKKLRLRIHDDTDSHVMDQHYQGIQKSLRDICMTLLERGVQLEDLTVDVQYGYLHASHDNTLFGDVLGPLKELRISGAFRIDEWHHRDEETIRYIADMEKIATGKGLADEHTTTVSTQWHMYQDLIETVRRFRAALSMVGPLHDNINWAIDTDYLWNELDHIAEASHLLDTGNNFMYRANPEYLEEPYIPAVLTALTELLSTIPIDWEDTMSVRVVRGHDLTYYDVLTLFQEEMTAVMDWLYLRPQLKQMAHDAGLKRSNWWASTENSRLYERDLSDEREDFEESAAEMTAKLAALELSEPEVVEWGSRPTPWRPVYPLYAKWGAGKFWPDKEPDKKPTEWE